MPLDLVRLCARYLQPVVSVSAAIGPFIRDLHSNDVPLGKDIPSDPNAAVVALVLQSCGSVVSLVTSNPRASLPSTCRKLDIEHVLAVLGGLMDDTMTALVNRARTALTVFEPRPQLCDPTSGIIVIEGENRMYPPRATVAVAGVVLEGETRGEQSKSFYKWLDAPRVSAYMWRDWLRLAAVLRDDATCLSVVLSGAPDLPDMRWTLGRLGRYAIKCRCASAVQALAGNWSWHIDWWSEWLRVAIEARDALMVTWLAWNIIPAKVAKHAFAQVLGDPGILRVMSRHAKDNRVQLCPGDASKLSDESEDIIAGFWSKR